MTLSAIVIVIGIYVCLRLAEWFFSDNFSKKNEAQAHTYEPPSVQEEQIIVPAYPFQKAMELIHNVKNGTDMVMAIGIYAASHTLFTSSQDMYAQEVLNEKAEELRNKQEVERILSNSSGDRGSLW